MGKIVELKPRIEKPDALVKKVEHVLRAGGYPDNITKPILDYIRHINSMWPLPRKIALDFSLPGDLSEEQVEKISDAIRTGFKSYRDQIEKAREEFIISLVKEQLPVLVNP